MMTLSLWGGKPLWEGYRLRRLRGKGGFGQVWEAETPTGERVALKFLPCGDGFSSPRELRSIMAIHQLSHPNLLRTERVWSSKGFLVVSMELAEGSLADVLEVGRVDQVSGLPRDVVCDYLSDAASALDFLNTHQHRIEGRLVGIQHGDVKPGNLLVFGERVKLGDFGLATQITEPLVPYWSAGTTAYAAPEVFEGQLSDWSDQYALAVTYCELRGGRLPFPRNPSRFSRTYARREADLSMLPVAEARVIQRALKHVPRDRWPSCREMMAQLSSLPQRPNLAG